MDRPKERQAAPEPEIVEPGEDDRQRQDIEPMEGKEQGKDDHEQVIIDRHRPRCWALAGVTGADA